jgi:hypothetical protein
MKLVLSCIFITLMFSQNNIPSKAEQIKRAVLALPVEYRADATVLGYRKNGDFGRIRKGTNQMICIADNPNKKGFNVAGYHKSLEPFMKRGRDIRAAGKNGNEVFRIRAAEAKSGQLIMPKKGTALHIYYADKDDYNAETNSIRGGHYRYVVYIPYETAESTGLPTSPIIPGAPWIMHPGTHRAHIMISPPKTK